MWERAKQVLDGDPVTWSPALKSAITLCVETRTPMLLWWGPSLTQLCNDAAIPELDRLNTSDPALLAEVERVKRTGTLTHMGSMTLIPIFDAEQAIAGVAGAVVRETTQAVRSSTQATTDDREVVASVSHELRNSLSTVSMVLQALRLEAPSERLETMNRAIQQVTRIIDNIVDSSSLTHGRIILQRETTDIASLVQRATELAVTRRPVHVAAPAATSLVDADAKRLAAAIANLITNASATASRDARVNVSTRQHGDRVEIRISDDGGQRDPAEVTARTEPTLRLAHQNARGIIELHGGSVSLADSPGNRPECVITLPVSRASIIERPVASASQTKRVLLVEDNDEGARALEAALVHGGYHVALAHDAPIALSLARTFKPDVVLVDLGLPVMDGWELAKRLRLALSELPMVAVTARDQPGDFQRSAELGFAEHLVKPVDVVELDRVVRRISP